MAENTRNLCAQIPTELHSKVREHQEASSQTLGQYMTWLITKFYEEKEYLKKNGVKQNAFFLDCIQKALETEKQEDDGGC